MKVDGEEINYDGLPAQCRETVRVYIEHGVDPGTGWTLIFSNSLTAVIYCDDETVRDIQKIWRWIHNHAPSRCHGSAERVAAWMRGRRAARIPELQPITVRPVGLTAPEFKEATEA